MDNQNSDKTNDLYQDNEMGTSLNFDKNEKKINVQEQKVESSNISTENNEINKTKQQTTNTPVINYYHEREKQELQEDSAGNVESINNIRNTEVASSVQKENSQIIEGISPQKTAEVQSKQDLERELYIKQSAGKTIGEVKNEYIYKKGGNTPSGNVLLKRKKAAHARKKAALGCLGGVIFMLVILLVFSFVFVSNTSIETSPMAKMLGINQSSFVNGLITTVHVIFITFALLAFIFTMVGLFKTVMARKTEVDIKKSGIKTSIISGIILFLVVIVWMFAYVYLDGKRIKQEPEIQHGVITTPEETLNLLAPATVKFDASDIPVDTDKFKILSYVWDFGDGATSNSEVASHEYTEVGRFDVVLTVTTWDKKTEEESEVTFKKIVTIASEDMAAIFTVTPKEGEAPLLVKFDASDSKAPDSKIVKYEWDLNGDGEFDDAEGVETEFEFKKIGRYNVELRITNAEGEYALKKEEVVVDENLSPTAVINVVGDVKEFKLNTAYVFKADDSTPSLSNSKIVEYQWHFGNDSKIISTKSATYTFEKEGTYDVTLKVIDEEGKEGETTMTINIGAVETAPKAVIASDTPIRDGVIDLEIPKEVTFNAKRSTDADNNIVDYEWDFDGDGEADQFGEMVTYKYDTEGSLTVNLKVIDADGNTGTDSVQVKAVLQGLTADMSVNSTEGTVPLSVNFDGTGSSYDGGKIVSYEWDFGDNTAPKIASSTITHKYSTIGTYKATLTVVGEDGKRASDQVNIIVREIPLQSCFTSVFTTGIAPLETAFDSSCSTGSVSKYFWKFGDGQTSTGTRPIHTFKKPGTYTTELEVSDNDGTVNTFSMDIEVSAKKDDIVPVSKDDSTTDSTNKTTAS